MEAAPGGQRQLAPGAMLDDKYRIERLLAVGGMGAVYVGTHIKLRKRVAIKVLNPQISTPAMVERFHREAITASQIGHEGIAQVTDLGTSIEGEPFLVMEYLEGESLAARLRASGALPIDVACELGCSILAPLDAAHRAGIVHRDLKPDNVFLVRQSRGEMVKLLDFGISRSQGLEGEFRLTTTGLVLGTPYYMSPEQARGDTQIGTAADLYAFGVIMYEMLIGSVPIQGENYNQLMYRVMTGDFVRPGDARPDLPEPLQQIILQAMSLEAAHRPPSATQLEQMLLPFCGPSFRQSVERISHPAFRQSAPLLRTPAPAPTGQTTGTDRTVLAAPSPSVMTPPKKSRALPLAIAVVAAAGLAIGVFVLLNGGGDDKPPAAAPVAVQPPPPPAPPKPPVVEQVKPPETITLHFEVTPATATIQIDGKAIDGADVVQPKDAAKHEVVIAAPGFAAKTVSVTFDETQRLTVELVKEAKRPIGKAGSRPGPNGRDGRTNRIDTESPYK